MSGKVRIRMYNVGFGDSFLLTLPGPRAILIDAGFHSQGRGKFSAKELVEQIVADVTEIHGKPRIDVIIATHRHADHIFAFNADDWDQVEVGEVWMPWVEDRQNSEARKLWKGQTRFAQNLFAARGAVGLDADELKDVEFILWNAGIDVPGMQLEGAAGFSNARALDCLHGGFASRERDVPRFLPEGDAPETFTSDVLPGVKVHVLGPMRDPDLIQELDPARDDETYRALDLVANESIGLAPAAPFDAAWQVQGDPSTGGGLEYADIERMEKLARSVDAVFAAEKVDGMINSTSLVLVLQVGKARLLLPGDAEWGTWKHILANEKSLRHLKGATFFKVGHHGSHNATSKTLVEKVLPKNIPAMISTQEGEQPYRKDIPLTDLLGALHDHGIDYVRSDDSDHAPEQFIPGDDAKWVDLEIPC